MLLQKGRKIPVWKGVLVGRKIYAQTISDLLHKELGGNSSAIKQLMLQTHATERTVKHWLSAQNGPNSVFLLRLIVSSPIIRAFVLGLIDSPLSRSWAATVDCYSLSVEREAYSIGEGNSIEFKHGSGEDDPINGLNHVPKDVPEGKELNERQHWFMGRIACGKRCGAKEIMLIWQVSLKTARRDISSLRQARLLEYTGSCRKGRYRIPS
jgi:hypothetical protein